MKNINSEKIFISSTFIDLQEHRKAVLNSLNKIGFSIGAMEYFCSTPETPFDTCMKELNTSTIYIGIIGTMYGSIEAKTKKSYTHLEYEKAVELSLPRYIFLIDEENYPILDKYIESDEKNKNLENFKSILKAENTVSFFTTPEDLVNKILESLLKSFKNDSNNIFSIEETTSRTSWHNYLGLFNINNFKVAYIPIINTAKSTIMSKLKLNDITTSIESIKYKLPAEFDDIEINVTDDSSCCRLSSYSIDNAKINIKLSETSYIDYLKSGEHLDDPYKGNTNITLRDTYGNLLKSNDADLRLFNLTNICGCGIFVITSDNYILATKHHKDSKIYPSRLTYSASGTMKYGACPNPFTEILIKTREEIHHQINIEHLYMIGFGADARKLYFQFSFIENINSKYTEFITTCQNVEILPIPLELNPIINQLFSECWEPAAEATMLTIAIDKFGYENVKNAIMSHEEDFGKREMKDEWDYRASNGGYISTLSVRYPHSLAEQISKEYKEAVLKFVEADIKGKDVLEIGSGDGRFTKHLANICNKVLCIDLCERMNEKNREHFSILPDNVEIKTEFAQNFYTEKIFDVALMSLVLIHNVSQQDFEDLISNICKYSKIIFVFEDVTKDRRTSSHTKIRQANEIIFQFNKRGFELECQKKHCLHNDTIMFFKFIKQ